MTHKELKRLADSCRKAGIISFKNADVEFTLASTPPVHTKRFRNKKSTHQSPEVEQGDVLNEDVLSQEDLLFWSTGITEENQ